MCSKSKQPSVMRTPPSQDSNPARKQWPSNGLPWSPLGPLCKILSACTNTSCLPILRSLYSQGCYRLISFGVISFPAGEHKQMVFGW